jgi:hypothetical protein
MEEFLKHLTWIGPVALVALALLLKGFRHAFFPKTVKTTQEVLTAAPAQSQGPSRASEPETYDGMVRRVNAQARKDELSVSRVIQEAIQEAQRRAVEENRPTKLTLFDPAEVKEGDPFFLIEDLPKSSGVNVATSPEADLVIDDRRPLLDEKHGTVFLPKHLREARDAEAQARRRAVGSATDLQDKIDEFTARRDAINAKADTSLEQVLVEIKADARKVATGLLGKYKADHQREAIERRVSVEQVEQEFMDLVAFQAENEARDMYRHASIGCANRYLAR